MKNFSKFLSVCAILALLVACAAVSAQATNAIPTQTPHSRTDICPCKTCNGNAYSGQWTVITKATANSDFVDGGHYVLTDTVDLTGRNETSNNYFNITGNKELVILVEGTLQTADNDRAIRVGMTGQATAKVWLLGNGGKITGTGRNNNIGTLIRVGTYGMLNIGGDLIVEPTAEAVGGSNHQGVIDIVAGGTVNLNGGTIKGIADTNNASSGTGGAFYNLGTLNINGGVVYGGTVNQGGAIYSKGTLTINNGTVTGGTAINGGTVYVADGSFTMNNGSVGGGTANNGNIDDNSGHGGSFYLAAGTISFNGGTVTAGTANKGTIDSKAVGGRGATIYAITGFTIDGTTINGGGCRYGGAIYITAADLTLNGGTIYGNATANAVSSGGAIFMAGSSSVTMGSSTANPNGATVNGSTITTNGGAIYVNTNATLTVNKGTINGGTAAKGGAIYETGDTAEIEINNGTISGGTAANGGTVYINGGTFTMTDGTVTGGTAKNDGSGSSTGHGGGFYLGGGSATLQGGSISGGTTVRAKDANGEYQGGNGGTFYVASTLNLAGAAVTGGTSNIGAAIYVTGSNGKVNMTDGTVTSGTINSQGAVAAAYSSGTLDISGGTVVNNVRGKSGIRVQGGGKLILRGEAHIKAGAGSRDAVDVVSTGSTRAYLVLAGNARISDPDGNPSTANSVQFNWVGTSYYPILQVDTGWIGYAPIACNFDAKPLGGPIFGTGAQAQCGTWDAENNIFTAGGSMVTTGITFTSDLGVHPVFGEEGKLILPRAKAVVEGTTTWYRTTDEAADTACNGGYAVLYAADANPITIADGSTAYIDFNGVNTTVTGEGTLYGTDSSALATGAGTTTVNFEDVTVKTLAYDPVTGDAYIAIKDSNTVSFHAVTANITSVSVRPSSVGMYYSAQFICDDTIKNNYLDTFGIAVSLAGMPGETFATDKTSLYTENAGSKLENGDFNSVLIDQIMLGTLAESVNQSRGEMPIYANAYMKLTVQGESVTVMASNTAQYSLETLLQHVNTYWDTFSETTHESLATMIYEPYVRNFEGDDWSIYNIRIKANGGYTAEEEAILDERRQTVLDYMMESISLLWRSDKTFTYSLGNTERDNGKSFTIEKGRLYRGLPYVYAAGTRDSFLEYAGEPDEHGIYTITGVEATALNYESYGGRVGNDCSGAVTNAWSQISTTVSASTSSGCSPYFGVVPVGNYLFNAPINPSTNRVLDTKVVVETNGEQVMYEAYAMLQPADAAYHQEYPSTKGNHIRMVKKVHVERNTDGTINGTNSYIIMLEQTRNLTSNNTTTTHTETGETIYVIGGIDRKIKFSSLFSDHYIPVTIKELRDPTPVEETWVADSLEEEATIDNLFTGNISSNRYTDAVKITIYNENGEIVQESISRKSRSYSKLFRMTQFVNEKPGSFKGLLDLEALPDGNYRCTVTLKLTIDSDYVHTVRDFTFSK